MPAAIAVGLAIFIPLSYLILFARRPVSVWLLEEDGVNETLGAVLLLIGAALAVSAWLATRGDAHPEYRGVKRLLLLALALLLLFGAGEEVSWGQRIFGWATPDGLADANAQDETNIHNLRALHGILTVSRLGQLFWLAFAFAVPALCLLRPRLRPVVDRFVPVLPLALGFLFILVHVVMKVVEAAYPSGSYDGPRTVGRQIVEIREMHVELLSLVALACIRFSLGRRRRSDDANRGEALGGVSDETVAASGTGGVPTRVRL